MKRKGGKLKLERERNGEGHERGVKEKGRWGGSEGIGKFLNPEAGAEEKELKLGVSKLREAFQQDKGFKDAGAKGSLTESRIQGGGSPQQLDAIRGVVKAISRPVLLKKQQDHGDSSIRANKGAVVEELRYTTTATAATHNYYIHTRAFQGIMDACMDAWIEEWMDG
ncbi:hypothetical protein BC829DRAFT_423345 [Chytridium lagenaria]|nr:hypothetical protein BC829DRAFT_423345 [Chytridium lagenaria]